MRNRALFTNTKPNLIVIGNVTTNTIYTAVQYKNHPSKHYNRHLEEIHKLILAGTPGSVAMLDSQFDIQNIRTEPYNHQTLEQINGLNDHYKNIFVSKVLANGSICAMSLVSSSVTTPALRRS